MPHHSGSRRKRTKVKGHMRRAPKRKRASWSSRRRRKR